MPNIFEPEDPLEQQQERQDLLPDSLPLNTPTAPIQYDDPLLRRVPTTTPPERGDVPYTLEEVPGTATPPQPEGLRPATPEEVEAAQPLPPEAFTPDGATTQQQEPEEEQRSFWNFMPVGVYNPRELIDPASAAPRSIPIDEMLREFSAPNYTTELLLEGAGDFSQNPQNYNLFGQGDVLSSGQLRQAATNFHNNVGIMSQNAARQEMERQRPVGVGVLPDGSTRIFPSTRNNFFGLPMSRAAREAAERPDTYFRFQAPYNSGSGWRALLPQNQMNRWANRARFAADIVGGLWEGVQEGLAQNPNGLVGTVLNALGSAGTLSATDVGATSLPSPAIRGSANPSAGSIAFETALRESTALQDVVRAFAPVVDEQGRSTVNPARGQFGQFGSAGVVSGLLYLANAASPESWITGLALDAGETAAGGRYRARVLDPLRGIDLGFTQEYNPDTVPFGTIGNPRLQRFEGGGGQTSLGVVADLSFGLVSGSLVGGGLNVVSAGYGLVRRVLPRGSRVVRSTSDIVANAAAASRRVVVDPEVPRWAADNPPAPFVFADPPAQGVDLPRTPGYIESTRQRAIANLRERPTDQARVRGRLARMEVAAARSVAQADGRGLSFVTDTARAVEYPMLRLSSSTQAPSIAGTGRAQRLADYIRDTNDTPDAWRTSLDYIQERRDTLGRQISDVSSEMRGLVERIVEAEDILVGRAISEPAEYQAAAAASQALEAQYAALSAQRRQLVREQNLWVYNNLADSPLTPRIKLAEYARGVYEAHALRNRVYYLVPQDSITTYGQGRAQYAMPNVFRTSDVPQGMVVESMAYDDYLEEAMPLIESAVLQPQPSRLDLPSMYRNFPETAGNVLMQRTWRSDEQLDALMRLTGVVEPDAPPLDSFTIAALTAEYGSLVSRVGPEVPMSAALAPVKRVEVVPADPLTGLGRVTYALDRLPPIPAASTRELAELMPSIVTDPNRLLPAPQRLLAAPSDSIEPSRVNAELANVLSDISNRTLSGTSPVELSNAERALLSWYGIGSNVSRQSETFAEELDAAFARLRRLEEAPMRVTSTEDYLQQFYDTALARQEVLDAFASNPTEAAWRYVLEHADPSMRPDPDTTNALLVQQAVRVGLAEVNYQNVAQVSATQTEVVEALAEQVVGQRRRVQDLQDYIPVSPAAELATRQAYGQEVPNVDGPSPLARTLPETPASRMTVDVPSVQVYDDLAPAPPEAVVSRTQPSNWLQLPPSATPDMRQFAQEVMDTLGSANVTLPPNERRLGAAIRRLRDLYNQELAPRTRSLLDDLWARREAELPPKPVTETTPTTTPQRSPEQRAATNEAKRGIVRVIEEAGLEPPTKVRDGIQTLVNLYTQPNTPQAIVDSIAQLWQEYGRYIPVELPARRSVEVRTPRSRYDRRPPRRSTRERADSRPAPFEYPELDGEAPAITPEVLPPEPPTSPTRRTRAERRAATEQLKQDIKDAATSAARAGASAQDFYEDTIRAVAEGMGLDDVGGPATNRASLEEFLENNNPFDNVPEAQAAPRQPGTVRRRSKVQADLNAVRQSLGEAAAAANNAEVAFEEMAEAAVEAIVDAYELDAVPSLQQLTGEQASMDVRAQQSARTLPLPLLQRAVSSVPPAHGTKVWIADVYDRLVQDNPSLSISLEDFKQQLLELNRRRVINLGRSDMSYAFDPDTVKRSETENLSSVVHYIDNRMPESPTQAPGDQAPMNVGAQEAVDTAQVFTERGEEATFQWLMSFDYDELVSRALKETDLQGYEVSGSNKQQLAITLLAGAKRRQTSRTPAPRASSSVLEEALPPSTTRPSFDRPAAGQSNLPEGTMLYDDATPDQQEWMVREGQDFMTPEDLRLFDLTDSPEQEVTARIREALQPPAKSASFRSVARRSLFHGTKVAEGFDPLAMNMPANLEFSLTNELGPAVYLTTNPERARTYALALRNPDAVPTAGTRFQSQGRVLEYRFDPDFLSKRNMVDADRTVADLPNNRLLVQTAEAFRDTAVAALPRTMRQTAARTLKRVTLSQPPREWWYEFRKLWIEAYGAGNLVRYRDTLNQIVANYPDKLQGFFSVTEGGHYDIALLPGVREYGQPTMLRDTGPLGRGTVEEAVMARVLADTDQYQRTQNEITEAAREYSLLRADTMNLDLARAEESQALEELARARQRLSASETELETLVQEERAMLRRAIEERSPDQVADQMRKFQPDNNINNPCI